MTATCLSHLKSHTLFYSCKHPSLFTLPLLRLLSMCSKTTRSSPRNRSMKKRKLKPQRKTRSLQRDFSPPASTTNSPESVESSHDHQLNLFPLHPDSFDEEKEVVDDYFFDTADTTTAPTLNGLLWSTSGEGGRGCAVSSEEDSLCPTLAYAYRGGEDHSEEVGSRTTAAKARLERSALRGGNKERDLSEERWVCYEEVTSCVPDYPNKIKTEEEGVEGGGLLLSLKLDYDEIMNAWSDKGPLYIDADGSQIVPDLLHDALRQDISHGFLDGGSVPQMEGSEGEIWKMRTREARVLRYKEKRQNRLFAKRIRYEVRKLNAEKRPRMKGRFVKRS